MIVGTSKSGKARIRAVFYRIDPCGRFTCHSPYKGIPVRSIVWLMGLLAVPQGSVPECAPDDQPRTLLVVSAPLYRPALEPWLERRWRQRYRVELIDPAETIGDSRGPEVVE